MRGLLTSQHEPGVNLFYYDWNSSKRNEGSRERGGVSRSGKRNTSANFFKHEDRTPTSQRKEKRGQEGFEGNFEKQGEKESKEGEQSASSSRAAMMSVSPRGE